MQKIGDFFFIFLFVRPTDPSNFEKKSVLPEIKLVWPNHLSTAHRLEIDKQFTTDYLRVELTESTPTSKAIQLNHLGLQKESQEYKNTKCTVIKFNYKINILKLRLNS